MTTITTAEWAEWTDERLVEFEQSLYDDEKDGSNNWDLRNDLLNEMNRRGLCK